MDEQIFYYLALVPLLGMVAQIIGNWIRVPSILMLLLFGVALGFWMNPDEILANLSGDSSLGPKIIFPCVSLAVAVILFEGGLTLRIHELQSSVGAAIIRLCTVGVLVSWVLGTLFAWWIFQIEIKLAVLLGAVLVVTGPTVVAPMLRYIRPNRKIGSVVKWEGIIIDPIGAILAVLVYEELFYSTHHAAESMGVWNPVIGILKTSVIGIGIGCATAYGLIYIVKRYWLPDYLHGVAFLSAAIGVFALSNWLMHESGLVTVTVLGIFLANQKQISIEHVIEFKENLGIFLISCLFIVLGSRLDLTVLGEVGWRGALFVGLMILIVRPFSVFVAMIGSKLSVNEKIFLAFLAPRGIVAAAVISVFSLRILASPGSDADFIADAEVLVPATFMLIVGTVAVYGLGAAPLARWLGLADANPQGILFAGADPWIRDIAATLQDAGFSVVVVDTNYHNVSATKMLGIPAYFKSILSEYVQERVNLTGIGKLFALTKNDAVNAMAVQEYAHTFGSKNVFRLLPDDADKGARSKVGHVAKGRTLFSENWGEPELQNAFRNGFRAKLTRLSDEFTFEQFLSEHGDDLLVVMTISDDGLIKINADGNDMSPQPNESVLALVRQVDED